MLPVIVTHSTEGATASSAIATLRRNGSESHDVLDIRNRQVYSLLPYDTPARSLRNLEGGVQTNRRGKVIQVELVGFASRSSWEKAGSPARALILPEMSNDDLAFLAHYLRYVCAVTGTPYEFPCRFAPYPESYGATPYRLSPEEWLEVTGIIGHMHVPENTHGDPGAINTTQLLKVGLSVPVLEAPEMNLTDELTLRKTAPDGTWTEERSNVAAALVFAHFEAAQANARVARLEAAVAALLAAVQAPQAVTAEAVADELAERLAD